VSELTTLDLGSNEIGDDGAISLSDSLKSNSTLTELYLGGNNIGDTVEHEIAQELETNKAIANLNHWPQEHNEIRPVWKLSIETFALCCKHISPVQPHLPEDVQTVVIHHMGIAHKLHWVVIAGLATCV